MMGDAGDMGGQLMWLMLYDCDCHTRSAAAASCSVSVKCCATSTLRISDGRLARNIARFNVCGSLLRALILRKSAEGRLSPRPLMLRSSESLSHCDFPKVLFSSFFNDSYFPVVIGFKKKKKHLRKGR